MKETEHAPLDLRPLPPPGPLHAALEAASRLERGQTLAVITRFRPVHLFEQLESIGIECEDEELPTGDWRTTFWHKPTP